MALNYDKVLFTSVKTRPNFDALYHGKGFQPPRPPPPPPLLDAQRSIFNEMRGVWIADETLSRVFDISFQSKQKLRSKPRSKIVKIYAN